ncbi:class I adenylate-forming enzyme family protein [Protofrankia coriariae]|uniref:class I adenylate-forming enzyme family protein n=1 Tax=Protofrankia coriariae TaxID=1562887 RepID=UPI00069A133A|nr:AMP-binding protein [Protofrankia coriariae]
MADGDQITAAQVLWDAARRHPDRPCLTDLDDAVGATTSTYAQLVERVAAVAGGLLGLGLEPGDRVALLLHNSHAYVQAYLGATAGGLVAVPLNVRLTPADYLHMLTDSGSRVLVTTSEFSDRLPDPSRLPGLTIVYADARDDADSGLTALAARAEPLARPVARADGDPASLMYTSGTTGSPKAVVLSHRSWLSIAETAVRVLGLGDDEVTLHVAPLTHGAGFLLLPTLLLGGHSLLCHSYDAGRALRLLTEHGVTGMFMVPSMIRMLLDARPPDWTVPASLRRLYYAGSPIDPETMREATEVFAGRLIQSFAQMESPMFFTVLDQKDHLHALGNLDSPLVRSAGRVLPGVELRIVDDAGATLPDGAAGEIVARAPQTMSGYWGRPADTARTMAGGWLHTGDIGYLDGDGYLYIVDRKKDMIVTGGSNVYAREVEDVLVDLPGVKDAAVIGLPHRIWGEAVTAVLVSANDSRDSDAVLAACRTRLAGYRVPKRVVWVESLPRNAYGKVLKRQLREQFSGSG